MRVLYASQFYTTHDRRFLQALVDGGFDTHFVALASGNSDQTEQALPHGVTQHAWHGPAIRKPDDARAAVALFRELARGVAPDVIQGGPLPSVALLLVLADVAPVLTMSWGSDVLREGTSDPAIAKEISFVLQRAGGLLADCRAVRDQCEAWVPGSAAKAYLFPWGIDLPAYTPTTSGDAGAARLKLLSTRTWAPIYGIETLVRGFAKAAQVEPGVDLLLAADGPLSGSIHALIKELALGSRLVLCGRLAERELTRLFSNVDGYIAATFSDGTSISLLEAMASALPVIVSDIPGNREWVTEGEGAFLAAPGDVDAYAAAITAFARTTPADRRRMGAHNRAVALERANWSANQQILWRALREVAASPRA